MVAHSSVVTFEVVQKLRCPLRTRKEGVAVKIESRCDELLVFRAASDQSYNGRRQ